MTLRKIHGQPVPRAPWGDDLTKYPPEAAFRIARGRIHGTNIARALREWESRLIVDLGGAESVTTAQRELVTLAGRAKLMLDSIDRWLLSQSSLILAKRKSLIPAVAQRASLAASLVHLLETLGLEQKPKPSQSLAEILAAHKAEQQPATTPQATTEAL